MPPLNRWPIIVVVVSAVVGACGWGSDAPRDTATTTMAAGQGSSSSPPPKIDHGDWDGVRYDVGILKGIDRSADGRTLLVFDRVQIYDEDAQLRSAKDFTEEPIVLGNRDVQFSNDNERLRTYVLHPKGEVLRWANILDTCSEDDTARAPRWKPVSVDDVVSNSLWKEYRQVSLTFDMEGRVIRVRLADGC